MWNSWLLLLIPAFVAHAADFCDPSKVTGPYAFQLSGSTSISGKPQPTVGLGRMVFDGSGKLSGTSSVTFSGLLLGNPVTGTYEVKPDCSITWKLQDDSGGFQNFSGKFTPDLKRAQVSQTDPGGTTGVLQKTSDSCNSGDLRRKYQYTVSGSTKAMLPGEVAHNVSAKGTLDTARDGDFHVDGDCSVHFAIKLPAPDGQAEAPVMNMRGFLVNDGKEIIGFQTDPGAMVAARLMESAAP
jgi:hypothetical protein